MFIVNTTRGLLTIQVFQKTIQLNSTDTWNSISYFKSVVDTYALTEVLLKPLETRQHTLVKRRQSSSFGKATRNLHYAEEYKNMQNRCRLNLQPQHSILLELTF